MMNEWEGRLRIGMFSNVYLPTTNGVVVSVERFRKALTKLGHDVFIFGPDSGDIEDRAPFIFRYPAIELPLQKYPLAFPVSPYIDHLLKNLKPQVLHANHPALLGKVAEEKSEELNLPLVYTYHTKYADYAHYVDPLPKDTVKEFIDNWLGEFMSKCHHVVVPSESIKKMLEETYGPMDLVSVVPTGIEMEQFTQYSRDEAQKKLGWSSDKRRLVSIGRLAKEKSFDVLLKAFAQLDGDDLELVIIGSGDEKKNLEKLAQELGVAERVVFTGLVPFEEVPVYLAASDLFCFASVTETQGLVTLEAMASGLPVVAVEASGTREAVSEDSSILTEFNETSLAAGIKKMLARDDFNELGELARKRAATFSALEQGKAMAEVYKKAIADHARGVTALPAEKERESRWQEFLKFFGK